MFCPRCGAENEDGNRYCVACGADLPGAKEQSQSKGGEGPSRSLLDRVIGTTRRARLLSAGTALAIVVAVVAFIALAPSEEESEDAYTRQLDRSCVAEKQTIAALRQQEPDLSTFAGALVTIVEEWRSSLQQPPPPALHAEAVDALDSALLEVLVSAGGLARLARSGEPQQIDAAAGAVDAASAKVERAVEDLGLSRCAELDVAATAATGP